MTQAIWKFSLALPHDIIIVRMPVSARALCVQVQGGVPCLWALVYDTEGPTVNRKFRTYGTGHEHESITGTYVGTYQLAGGALVFHVFEEAA